MKNGCESSTFDDDAFNHIEILCQVNSTNLISNYIAGRKDSLLGSG